MTDPLALMGQRVRALRETHSIKQADLAEACGVSRSSIANFEAGRQNIPVTTLILMAGELFTTVGALLGEVSSPELPRVHVTTTYVVECEDCGRLKETPRPAEAYGLRREHIRVHLGSTP